MAIVTKVLGHSAPAATTETLLYQAPSVLGTVVSTIVVCNRSATPDIFRVAVVVGGTGAAGNGDWIYYGVILAGNDTFAATFGITLAQNDSVKIYSTNSTSTFSLFGQEN